MGQAELRDDSTEKIEWGIIWSGVEGSDPPTERC